MPTAVKISGPSKQTTGKVSSLRINIAASNTINISLPTDLIAALKVKGGIGHAAVINGVLQISGTEPSLFIPAIGFQKEDYIPVND